MYLPCSYDTHLKYQVYKYKKCMHAETWLSPVHNNVHGHREIIKGSSDQNFKNNARKFFIPLPIEEPIKFVKVSLKKKLKNKNIA